MHNSAIRVRPLATREGERGRAKGVEGEKRGLKGVRPRATRALGLRPDDFRPGIGDAEQAEIKIKVA